MTAAQGHRTGSEGHGGYVVRTPRVTDAVGHTLRTVFGDTAMPHDFGDLLARLDRTVIN